MKRLRAALLWPIIVPGCYYLCTFVAGTTFGMLWAISSELTPKPDEGIKTYMAIAGVLLSGSIGLVASRTMDSISDRRRQRRRAAIAIGHLVELYVNWDMAINFAAELPNEGLVFSKETFSNPKIKAVGLAATAAFRMADQPDLFDELIEDVRDIGIWREVKGACDRIRTYCVTGDPRSLDAANIQGLIENMIGASTSELAQRDIRVLLRAIFHLSKRFDLSDVVEGIPDEWLRILDASR